MQKANTTAQASILAPSPTIEKHSVNMDENDIGLQMLSRALRPFVIRLLSSPYHHAAALPLAMVAIMLRSLKFIVSKRGKSLVAVNSSCPLSFTM